jgi:hypothetical protein
MFLQEREYFEARDRFRAEVVAAKVEGLPAWIVAECVKSWSDDSAAQAKALDALDRWFLTKAGSYFLLRFWARAAVA